MDGLDGGLGVGVAVKALCIGVSVGVTVGSEEGSSGVLGCTKYVLLRKGVDCVTKPEKPSHREGIPRLHPPKDGTRLLPWRGVYHRGAIHGTRTGQRIGCGPRLQGNLSPIRIRKWTPNRQRL
jgi:hypothetical protein